MNSEIDNMSEKFDRISISNSSCLKINLEIDKMSKRFNRISINSNYLKNLYAAQLNFFE